MKFEVLWKNPSYKSRPELKEDIECDYLIVGGGVTGVSLAYFLSKMGAKNIVLIEKNTIASGATGKAAGSLVIRGETDLADVIAKHGKEKGTMYWREIHEGLSLIKQIIKEENIDCDAEQQDTLYCGYKKGNYIDLTKEYRLEKDEEKTTLFLEGDSLKKELNTPLFAHAILSNNHGLSVNPLMFTQNLSNVINKKGVKIYENTSFLKLSKDRVSTSRGNIKFKKIIFALDAYSHEKKVRKNKSTIIITRPLTQDELVATGLDRRKIVWDSRKKYYYFKLTKDNRLLVGFGDTKVHKPHNKAEPHYPHLKQIIKFVKKLFPYLDLDIEYTWSGTFGVTGDYTPVIEIKDNVASIAGAATQVVCVMAAKHIAFKLLGKPSSLDDFF